MAAPAIFKKSDQTGSCGFVYAVVAIFLLPVSVYALVGRVLSTFLQSLALDISSLDRYGLV